MTINSPTCNPLIGNTTIDWFKKKLTYCFKTNNVLSEVKECSSKIFNEFSQKEKQSTKTHCTLDQCVQKYNCDCPKKTTTTANVTKQFQQTVTDHPQESDKKEPPETTEQVTVEHTVEQPTAKQNNTQNTQNNEKGWGNADWYFTDCHCPTEKPCTEGERLRGIRSWEDLKSNIEKHDKKNAAGSYIYAKEGIKWCGGVHIPNLKAGDDYCRTVHNDWNKQHECQKAQIINAWSTYEVEDGNKYLNKINDFYQQIINLNVPETTKQKLFKRPISWIMAQDDLPTSIRGMLNS